MMRIVYADPPYIGQANKYPEKTEVDHYQLMLELEKYDGWALSASSSSLSALIPIVNQVTTDYRIASWVKTFAVFKPNVNPAYTWEPVLFKPARGYTRESPTIRDWISGVITLKTGMIGAKPYYFCEWLFNLLGADCDDEFVDMFYGSGNVSRSWESWSKSRDFTRFLKNKKVES
jgi:hypothetical protein